jgi:Tn7-like transposition protein D
MISCGPVWEAKLKQYWIDSSLSLSEVGRRLGVDALTARRHAARLNLQDSRPIGKSKPLSRDAQLKGAGLTAPIEKQRTCRVMWISAMRQIPKTTLQALRRKLPREYTWLLQNDAAWLKSHSPSSRRGVRSTSGVDWKKRDAEYAIAVRVAATDLMNRPGRPVQVTMTAIGKMLSAVTLLRQKLSKMPLTAQVLASVVETRVHYAIRRIWWAADRVVEEGVLPRYWQLILRANVYSLKGEPEIKAVVEAAIHKLTTALLHESHERAVS